jgi:hypothetical protein
MAVSRQQLQDLLASFGPHAGSQAAADVLQRLADCGLGIVPLRAWCRGLFSRVLLIMAPWDCLLCCCVVRRGRYVSSLCTLRQVPHWMPLYCPYASQQMPWCL